ncbi:HEPN domain-containing protein [Oceanospirillum sediminis]|uniref:HEPN domain-containing protein n=1 Tax=Oceanospirillum sediminis TaxID=2760088 RepID=A0A839IIX4_9GAMM|nr:HEPN domain-containing protein [Oceanospirillum sediminis]MBB1485125.1 HEPN domain-containing protein [Oceanospirillum sediminis]
MKQSVGSQPNSDGIDYSKLTPDQWISLNSFAKDVITEFFIETAIEDYASARLLLQNKMFRQFYWNAAQALEKTLKAILLLNYQKLVELNDKGKQTGGLGHDLSELYSVAKNFVKEGEVQVFRPGEKLSLILSEPKYKSAHWTEITLDEFLRRVGYFGDPNNRYGTYGFEYKPSDLFILDQVMYCLASCVPHELMSTKVIQEKLISNTGFDLNSFYYHNYAYQPANYKNDKLMVIYSSAQTKLRKHLGPDNPKSEEDKYLCEQWLLSHIRINKRTLDNAKLAKHCELRVPQENSDA